MRENLFSGFPTRSHTNRTVQPQKMVRALKFQIKKVEGLCHQCNENKGTDQLRSYCAADLRLCFRICKKPVFSGRGRSSFAISKDLGEPAYIYIILLLSESLLFPNIQHGSTADLCLCFCMCKKQVSHEAAHIIYEPRHEKTNVLHMRKQRCRSASW